MRITAIASLGGLFALLMSFVLAPAFGAEGDYWTNEGKLLSKLEIEETRGGIAFQGTRYVIEPDGAWTITKFLQGTADESKQGTLSKDNLGKLVKELDRFDLKGLKDQGALVTNPNQVHVKFGQFGGKYTYPPGSEWGNADPKTMAGRYAGIVGTVEELLRGS